VGCHTVWPLAAERYPAVWGCALALTRICSRLLRLDDLVDSVFIPGHIGQDDTAIAISVSASADPARIASLLAGYRTIRWITGDCRVYDEVDRRTWWWTDTYRASIERRGAVPLRGEPLAIPELPVRPEHAARRCVGWLDENLATVLAAGDVRRLRNGALEMWNAMATAAGILPEPLLSHEDMAAQCKDERLSAHEPSRLAALCFHVARELHQRLLPPLKTMPEWRLFEVRLPPTFPRRTVSVIPNAETPLPKQARRPDALTLTPEALHLYLEYVNPFAAAALPAHFLSGLGIGQPTHDAFVRACRNYGAAFRTRAPGFENRHTAPALAMMRCCLHAIRFLREGRKPPALTPEEGRPASVTAYYAHVYPLLHADCERLWTALEWLTAPVA